MPDVVLFQDGDELNERNIAAVHARKNSTDYVESGMDIVPDFRSGTVTIGTQTPYGDHAILSASTGAYHVFPSQKTKRLATETGLNHVFLYIDTTAENVVDYHVDDEDVALSHPSIKIAIVDASKQETTVLNRAPSGEFDSVDTRHLNNRLATLEKDKRIVVDANGDGDYADLQEAVFAEVPYHFKAQLTIKVRDGDYSNTDLRIPGYTVQGVTSYEGMSLHLQIIGNQRSPEKTPLGSVFVGGTNGSANPKIAGFQIQRDTPHTDEKYGVIAQGCRGVNLYELSFTDGPTRGVLAYDSRMKVKNLHFGENNVNKAIATKRAGFVTVVGCDGNTSGYAFYVGGGYISWRKTSLTSNNPIPVGFTQRYGTGYDADTGTTYVPDKIATEGHLKLGPIEVLEDDVCAVLGSKSDDTETSLLLRDGVRTSARLRKKANGDIGFDISDTDGEFSELFDITTQTESPEVRYRLADRIFTDHDIGPVLTTPSGSDAYRLVVDENGNIGTEGPL